MPKLLTFAPCDNVILGQDNSVSLIQIMNQLVVSGDIPDPIPANSATQMRWFLFAQWEISPDEFGHDFQQRVRIVRAGQQLFEAFSDFTTEMGKNVHRMIANLTYFPLIPGGECRLQLAVRPAGENNPWQEAADYPMEIVYRHVNVPA